MDGRSIKRVRLGHGARSLVSIQQIAALQARLLPLAAQSVHRHRHAIFDFCHRIAGESMAEVLDNVKPVTATNHAQPDHVVGPVQQVRAMRG